jgi:TatD DNase family protein
MLFDTHVHLNSDRYKDDINQVINRALDRGVCKMLVVGYDAASNTRAIQLAEAHDAIYAAVGIHPSDARSASSQGWEVLRKQLAHPKVVALGECGLDYYHDTSFNDVQHAVFKYQLALAKALDMPVVVHVRESIDDTYAMLRKYGAGVGGVIHCYSGSACEMAQFLDLGFYIGLDGPVTFKNAHEVQEVAKKVPLDRLLLETDAPYLTPHPYRGKRNEPAHVVYVAEKIAELRGMSYKEVCRVTTENGLRLFKIGD